MIGEDVQRMRSPKQIVLPVKVLYNGVFPFLVNGPVSLCTCKCPPRKAMVRVVVFQCRYSLSFNALLLLLLPRIFRTIFEHTHHMVLLQKC